jgi:chromate reductase, NAD(P)H dehydrogenase (quinone)
MAFTPRILAFSGSLRRDSFNTRLVKVAAAGARAAGADVTVIELREFPMPLLNEDLEKSEGMPEHAKRFRRLLAEHHGVLIASPEYNSSISGALKNAIDWASRAETGGGSLDAYEGKVAAIMAASPGALGGMRGLVHLRSILGNIKTIVLPEQVSVMKAHEAFEADGQLKDAKQQASVEALGSKLTQILAKLKG